MNTITIGKTNYTVEHATEDSETYFLTGPRGGTLIAVPYINNPDTYHAFRAYGNHDDLKVAGRVARINRTDLANAGADNGQA